MPPAVIDVEAVEKPSAPRPRPVAKLGRDPFEPLKADIEDRVRKAARNEVIKWTIIMWVVKEVMK
jgi:hypothetical protein